MQLTLYYAPGACSVVPWITLTEAGAAFEVVPVDNARGGNMRPEFLAINPKHKVPVLVVDGRVLTENIALQIWIARSFPEARLLPADPWAEAQAISLMSWCSAGIHPHLTPHARPQRFCDLPGSEDSVKRVASGLLAEDFALADQLLAGREWFMDHFTAVDAYFHWCQRRARSFGIDFAPWPACRAHFQRMEARPSVVAHAAFEKQLRETLARA